MNRLSILALGAVAALAFPAAAGAQDAGGAQNMSFFITSAGPGDGANLDGLEGADAHCQTLAEAAGSTGRNWRAYLSAMGNGTPVHARERIGAGPWVNAKGAQVAATIEELHSEANTLNKETGLTEKGEAIPGRGETPNKHDILTGSNADGTLAADMTCSDWTANGDGSAMVGHFDRTGGGSAPTSWNASHPSRGCSQEALQGTGGDGLFYCFAAD